MHLSTARRAHRGRGVSPTASMASQVPLLAVACLTWWQITLTVLVPAVRAELSADPVELAVEPGETAEFICSWVGEDNNATAKEDAMWWTHLKKKTTSSNDNSGNGGSSTNQEQELQQVEVNLSNSSTSSRVEINKGALTIRNVSWGDAGDYLCRDDSGSEPARFTLIVYDMPGYATEGLALTGIGAVLLVVVLVGSGLKVRSQRQTQKKKKRPEAGGGEDGEGRAVAAGCGGGSGDGEKYQVFKDRREVSF